MHKSGEQKKQVINKKARTNFIEISGVTILINSFNSPYYYYY